MSEKTPSSSRVAGGHYVVGVVPSVVAPCCPGLELICSRPPRLPRRHVGLAGPSIVVATSGARLAVPTLLSPPACTRMVSVFRFSVIGTGVVGGFSKGWTDCRSSLP